MEIEIDTTPDARRVITPVSRPSPSARRLLRLSSAAQRRNGTRGRHRRPTPVSTLTAAEAKEQARTRRRPLRPLSSTCSARGQAHQIGLGVRNQARWPAHHRGAARRDHAERGLKPAHQAAHHSHHQATPPPARDYKTTITITPHHTRHPQLLHPRRPSQPTTSTPLRLPQHYGAPVSHVSRAWPTGREIETNKTNETQGMTRPVAPG